MKAHKKGMKSEKEEVSEAKATEKESIQTTAPEKGKTEVLNHDLENGNTKTPEADIPDRQIEEEQSSDRVSDAENAEVVYPGTEAQIPEKKNEESQSSVTGDEMTEPRKLDPKKGAEQIPISEGERGSAEIQTSNGIDGPAEEKAQSQTGREKGAAEAQVSDPKEGTVEAVAVQKQDPDGDGRGVQKPKEEVTECPVAGEITDAPQHPEHLDMSLLGQSPVLRSTYIKVSDDEGQILDSVDKEAKLKRWNEKFQAFEKGQINETSESLLGEGKAAALEYAKSLNQAFALSEGAQTKSRMRLGQHFRNMKKLIKKSGRDWTKWFSENFDERYLRSIEDYMRLAGIPNIIRFAVFGKERLMEILRAVGRKNFGPDEDPVADFMAKHKLVFDPESEEPIDTWRVEIDAAIAMDRIQAVAAKEDIILNPSREIIKNIIGMGISVNTKMIADMVLIEENNGNINRYLEVRFVNGSSKERIDEDRMVEGSRMVDSIGKVASRFQKTVEYLKNNEGLIQNIDFQHLDVLEAQIKELRAIMAKAAA